MSKILLPNPDRKRALIVVDMQRGFLGENNQALISNVQAVLAQAKYEMYVEAVFHAEKGSLWDIQTGWTFPLEETVSELGDVLRDKGAVKVIKTTKSAFGGDRDLMALFKQKGIEEVHIVGVDTNDCILATAYDSFDGGFFTYVIEECVASSAGKTLHQDALEIMRHADLTNHSDLIRSHESATVK